MTAILVDTGFLIALADPAQPHHATARTWLRESVRAGVPLYLSTLVAAEFERRQPVADLPLRHFVVLPFNIDHAVLAGRLLRPGAGGADDGAILPPGASADDLKLVAQAVAESLTHVLVADARGLARQVARLAAEGRCALKAIVLAEGFDPAWLNDGQRSLPGT